MRKYIPGYFAFVSFIVIVAGLTGCSSNNSKEVYEGALKKTTQKQFAEAAKDFENIVQEEPSSEFAAKSMLQLANMHTSHLIPNMKRADDYQKAYKYYLQVFNDFQGSPEAGKACLELGKYYQSMLDVNLPKEPSMKKAISYYSTVVDKYSQLPEAETAAFMIAFIQANEFNQQDSAKVSYEAFIKKYPNSKLALSARAELQILGKRPEELIKVK